MHSPNHRHRPRSAGIGHRLVGQCDVGWSRWSFNRAPEETAADGTALATIARTAVSGGKRVSKPQTAENALPVEGCRETLYNR